MAAQVVIQRTDTGEFLRRKGSYDMQSWTRELQVSQVFSATGVKAAIKRLNRSCWDLTESGPPMMVAVPVLISLLTEKEN